MYDVLQGKFISFEGVEGSGKTTLISQISSELESNKIGSIVTREPGGTQVGEEIRDILLAHRKVDLTSDTELLLFAAGRAQHITEKIKPALQKGTCVLCDRFTDASSAYQGAGRGIDFEKIHNLESWVLQGFFPDVVVIVDVPVEVGFKRARSRGDLDRIEMQETAFFERIRQYYLSLADKDPKRYMLLDGSKTIESVLSEFWDKIYEYLK